MNKNDAVQACVCPRAHIKKSAWCYMCMQPEYQLSFVFT